MAVEKFRHLFLPGPTNTHGFTNPRRGRSEQRIPRRDRNAHSKYLINRLQNTWDAVDQQCGAYARTEREGVYIDFVSELGFDLVIKSLEDRRQGIRLRNARTEGEAEQKRTYATVFVPLNKRGSFLRKITAYSTELTKSGKPKNAKLVDSISDIQLAVLESFWHPNERSMIPTDNRDWVELWISTEKTESFDNINKLLSLLGIESGEGFIEFPERLVKLIYANRAELEKLILSSDNIAEFRVAKHITSYYIELDNKEQTAIVQNLLKRTTFDDKANVSICILDTGVNNGHVLIRPILDDDDLHAVKPQWEKYDHVGHGTLMAGTAIYGDMLSILNSGRPVFVGHILESSKILPKEPNPKKLWGYITSQGISLAEIQAPERQRIICMAVTASDESDRGRPSSWSGSIDELASGYDDDKQRLIIISAGNVNESVYWRNYFNDNLTNEIHDPGQSWNALTVGAYTEKVEIRDPTLDNYYPIAPRGGLSPFSTTSYTWPSRKWPIKPEVLFEGGNVAQGPNDVIAVDDLKLISTNYQPNNRQLAPFDATSAASAQAAWFAAQIQIHYPQLWPETIRALTVHSADWTKEMKGQFLHENPTKTDFAKLLRICGYGVPNLNKALYCLSNSLTLISQATLQPYDKRDTQYVTRDMHIYNLPWPNEVLHKMGETQVSMRITLSYFIEPSPSEVGWNDRYRYASHALRFDLNGPGESENEFLQRVNDQARDGTDHQKTEGVSQNWTIGEARNVGSIHSDIWTGLAVDLASSNMIAVYPAVGWWRERNHIGRWNKRCRYSLVISIYTPEQEIDIYTPVAIQLGIKVPVEIKIRNEL